MENKKFELIDEELDLVSGGTDNGARYWGFGVPPKYLNACPRCGGPCYSVDQTAHGYSYWCGPCQWQGNVLAPGYTLNPDYI